MALDNLFGGPATVDSESAGDAITAGDYVLVCQGVFDGAKVIIQGDVFGTYDNADAGLIVDQPSFTAFRFPAATVRAVVRGSGAGTSIQVGIYPAA
jgi:hypothetical protein